MQGAVGSVLIPVPMNGYPLGRPAQRRGASRPLVIRRAAASSWLGIGLICAQFLATPTARAQTSPDDLARQHFGAGAAYFDEAEYEEALKAFKKAYELSRRPRILINISTVYERLNNLPEAIAALDQYLERSPDDADVDTFRRRRDNLQKRLEADRSRQVQPPPAAPTPPPASPGPRAAVASSAPPPPEPGFFEARSPYSYVALGVGAAAGIAAIATGVLASGEYDDLQARCGDACPRNETDTGRSLAVSSTVLTGVSLVGLGVGTWLWFTSDRTQSAALRVTATPERASAQLTWKF